MAAMLGSSWAPSSMFRLLLTVLYNIDYELSTRESFQQCGIWHYYGQEDVPNLCQSIKDGNRARRTWRTSSQSRLL